LRYAAHVSIDGRAVAGHIDARIVDQDIEVAFLALQVRRCRVERRLAGQVYFEEANVAFGG